jgi:hypothetical protein
VSESVRERIAKPTAPVAQSSPGLCGSSQQTAPVSYRIVTFAAAKAVDFIPLVALLPLATRTSRPDWPPDDSDLG